MITYLEKQVRFLNDTPKLSPDVNVFLKRRDCQCNVVLFHGGDVTPPLQERHVLLRLDLMCCHGAVPIGSPWDRQWYILPSDLFILAKEDIDHGH